VIQRPHGDSLMPTTGPTHLAASEELPRPQSVARAWALVCFLCLLYALSSVDRLILVLLVDPIAKSLGATDTQIGLLVGIGFVAAYVLAGLPAAHVVDQGHRRWLLAIGVGLWSLCTMASAFAGSYAALFLARTGVAVGEAVLTPVAISLIAELFPRERRSAPTSLFVATGVLMGAGALLFGGAAVQLAEIWSPILGLEVWRTTLLIVGAPGILLSIVSALVITDGLQLGGEFLDKNRTPEDWKYLSREGRAFIPFFLGIGCLSAISLGLVVWAPTLLARSFGYSASQAGYILGLIGMPASVVGTLVAPRLAHWLLQRKMRNAVVVLASILAFLGAITLIASLHNHNEKILLIGVGISVCALAGATVLPAIVVQLFCPQDLRARMMAMNLLCLNVLGLGLGPVAMAEVAKLNDGDIGAGISAVAATALVGAWAAFFYGASALAAKVDQAAAVDVNP